MVLPNEPPVGAGHFLDNVDGFSNLSSPSILVSVPLVIFAGVVWFIEMWARKDPATADTGTEFGMATCRSLIRLLGPEAMGLAVLGMISTMLLMQGKNNGAQMTNNTDQHLWQTITGEWPLLKTADSLLALQAMLRFLLVISITFRRKNPQVLPFIRDTFAWFCLAAICRVTMLALSPRDVYQLDGPLGGKMNLAFEVVVLPFFLFLCFENLPNVLGLVVGIFFATWVAWYNRLALADPTDIHLDVLFSLEHLFELFAAVAFFVHAMVVESKGVFATFLHLFLPFQQFLSAYFMLTGWGAAPFEPLPELVGLGRPFEMLQLGGAMQVGIYLLAVAMYIASRDACNRDCPLLEVTNIQLTP